MILLADTDHQTSTRTQIYRDTSRCCVPIETETQMARLTYSWHSTIVDNHMGMAHSGAKLRPSVLVLGNKLFPLPLDGCAYQTHFFHTFTLITSHHTNEGKKINWWITAAQLDMNLEKYTISNITHFTSPNECVNVGINGPLPSFSKWILSVSLKLTDDFQKVNGKPLLWFGTSSSVNEKEPTLQKKSWT